MNRMINPQYEKIREKAEQIVSGMSDDKRLAISADVDTLLHELQVYHVELELQNEELRRAQDEIEKSLQLYIHLFNRIPVGNIIVNEHGIILKANEYFCSMSCRSMDDIEGKSFANIVEVRDQQLFYSLFSSFYKSPEGKRMDLKITCNHQISKDVEITGQQIQYFAFLKQHYGKGPFLMLTLIDKSRHNQMIVELERSERKYRTLADNVTDLVWVYNLNRNKFEYISPSVQSLWGYTVQEALALRFEDIVVPEQLTQVRNQVEEGLNRFVTSPGIYQPSTTEIMFVRKDRSTGWVETTARMTYNDNKEVEILGVSRNIDQRKHLEEQMIRMSYLVKHSSLGMVITNKEGIVEYVNPKICEISGYSEEELLGQYAEMFRAEKSPPNDEMWQLLHQGKNWQGLFYNQRKDGSEYWESAHIDCVVNAAGDVTHFVSVKEDVTSKIQQEKELRNINLQLEAANAKANEMAVKAQEANLAKSTFLANMSHEIRTPLNAVIGFSQLIERQPHLTPVIREYNSLILRSGEHLLSLINDVLELERIESGRYDLDESNVSLDLLMKEILSVYIVSAQQKQIELRYRPEKDIPDYIYADATKLRRVLINLVSNAVKFTYEGFVDISVSVITTAQVPCCLCFTVTDTGVGIADFEMSKIFKRFEQTNAGKNHNTGSGLGLSLVYEMVKLMGGNVEVKSKLGEGSTFTFYLPLRKGNFENAPLEANSQIVKIKNNNGLNYRVLVVDDSEENLRLSVEILKNVGFETIEAINGAVAIEKYSEYSPDLVLINLYMPAMDGFQTLNAMYAIDSSPMVPVVAISAGSMEDEREKVIGAGFKGYLLKPFKLEELLKMIGRLLNIEYETQTDLMTKASATINPDYDLLRTQLLDTDEVLREQMIHMLKLADLDSFVRLVGTIHEKNKYLALYLQEMAENYNYEAIFTLINTNTEL